MGSLKKLRLIRRAFDCGPRILVYYACRLTVIGPGSQFEEANLQCFPEKGGPKATT